MRRTFFLLLYISMATGIHAQYFNYGFRKPKYEARAVWLTTIGGIDWPHSYAQNEYSIRKQKLELTKILDQLQKAGINQVLLQTRIRATTIYPSHYEPWDGCLSGNPGKSPGYDPLAYAIEETHKRGMELHAWIVTIPVGKWNTLGCAQLRNRYPSMIRKIGHDGFMNPEKAQTATYLADLCEEIVCNYDIDGIHLDYIRYPETWNIKVSKTEGRRYITNIVKAIHDRIKPIKPYLKLSCSPIGKSDDLSRYWSHGWNAYNRVCQDAQSWLRDGLMDELFPMMYFQGQQFFPFAIDWSENTFGRIVAPGLGIYFLSATEKNWSLDIITREMEVLRQYNLGHAFFRSKFFTDNVKGIYDFAAKRFDNNLALVPPMSWQNNVRPKSPLALEIKNHKLIWRGRDGEMFNIYSSRTYPVNINDANNLIKIRTKDTYLTIPVEDEPRYYAVTVIDRYGNESIPLQMDLPTEFTKATRSLMLFCNGLQLKLPVRDSQNDADILIIEDLKGKNISSHLWNKEFLEVGSLQNGMYQLRSLNNKGITRRLGFFRIRR